MTSDSTKEIEQRNIESAKQAARGLPLDEGVIALGVSITYFDDNELRRLLCHVVKELDSTRRDHERSLGFMNAAREARDRLRTERIRGA